MHNLAVFAIACTLVCASFISAVPVTVDPLENQNLFEGDLDIPEEMIQLYYGESNDTESNGTTVARTTRAAISNQQRLWPGGKVYYTFDSSVNWRLRNSIRDAINIWKTKTCLKFVLRTNERDYIEFTSNADECSSYVGMKGGSQVIKLQYPDCNNVGVILHEIGHAVGFWHEQSRPDRDSYVRILTQNIEDYDEYNFRKRTPDEVDYQGVSYDYDSIMHYRIRAYSRNGGPTIIVTNLLEYIHQGLPNIGQRTHLSQRDIEQTNRLYHTHCRNECSPQPCRNGGTCVDGFATFTCNCRSGYTGTCCQYRIGNLRFYARYGRGLPDKDILWNDSDPYLEVIAYDYFGNSVRLRTRTDRGDESPTWNQWLEFGTRAWSRFTVRVWDEDRNADDALSSRHVYYISSSGGAFRDNRLNAYSGYVYFNYYYIV